MWMHFIAIATIQIIISSSKRKPFCLSLWWELLFYIAKQTYVYKKRPNKYFIISCLECLILVYICGYKDKSSDKFIYLVDKRKYTILGFSFSNFMSALYLFCSVKMYCSIYTVRVKLCNFFHVAGNFIDLFLHF